MVRLSTCVYIAQGPGMWPLSHDATRHVGGSWGLGVEYSPVKLNSISVFVPAR